MELKEFLEQALDECGSRLHRTLRGLTPEELAWRPGPEANSIAFIVWHVGRVGDRWTQRFARDEVEVWVRDGWHEKYGLPQSHTGVGYTLEQVEAFPEISSDDLRKYFDDVRAETMGFLKGLNAGDFEKAPERTPFPEVESAVRYFEGCTIARMFRQLIGEENQHLGHVAYLRGLQRGLNK